MRNIIMNIFTRIKLGLFGINNPTDFRKAFEKHISDMSLKNTEELCHDYGFDYSKYAKWAKYESQRCTDAFAKRMLSDIYDIYQANSAKKEIEGVISKMSDINARTQKRINDTISKL